MSTPLVDALTNRMAGKSDAEHMLVLDTLARRLEESHARLLQATVKFITAEDLQQSRYSNVDIEVARAALRDAIAAAEEIK